MSQRAALSRPSRLLVLLVVLSVVLLAACKRPGEWDPDPLTARSVVPSPFPRNYSWALMIFDGALVGEASVRQPQRDIDSVSSRYLEGGIFINFGHGASRLYIELTPLEGTGRYFVDRQRGYFRLDIPQGVWESRDRSICSFNFWRVTGPEVPFSPPSGAEVIEVDIGFVCTSLAARDGSRELNIIDGRIHTFLLRPAPGAQ